MATSAKPRALIIFDYDLSLVDEDVDVFFLKQLFPELLAHVSAALAGSKPKTWCGLVNEALTQFHALKPHVTRQQVTDSIVRVPVQPRMLDAVRHVVDEYDAKVVVVSDANDDFIYKMISYHNLDDYITEVYSNPAHWDEEEGPDGPRHRMSVSPFHPDDAEPHGCPLCPTNMCKGRILDELRSKGKYDIVLYVGDGTGDYCPTTRMNSCDIVFARANDPVTGKSYGLLDRIKTTTTHSVQAKVVEWSTGEDIYEQFKLALRAAEIA